MSEPVPDQPGPVESSPVKSRPGRSDEELAMRALVVPKLRARWPEARIIHELPLRYSKRRIDLAAVTPTEIIAVEIKSSRDVMDRLEAQIRAFLPVSQLVMVCLAPVWNEQLPVREEPRKWGTAYIQQRTEAQQLILDLGEHVETWTCCHATGLIEQTEGHHIYRYRPSRPWSARLLDMLWRDELLDIAIRHRVATTKRPAHTELRDACEEFLTAREVRAAVCRALRGRDAFDKASDAPIRDAAPSAGAGSYPTKQQAELL